MNNIIINNIINNNYIIMNNIYIIFLEEVQHEDFPRGHSS